jgi:hypothetical protein
MRHLLPIFAAAALLSVSAPAFAQSVTAEQVASATSFMEDNEVSDEAYKNGWCGAAFSLVADLMTSKGDKASADEATGMKNVLFEKAGNELAAAGFEQADLETFGSSMYYLALSQTEANDGSADFTQEECTAAAKAQ